MYMYQNEDACGYKNRDHQTRYCGDAWKFFLSRANTIVYNDSVEKILFIVNYGVLILIQIYYYTRIHKMRRQRNSEFLSVKHLTLKLCNLPTDVSKSEIVDYFKTFPAKNEDGKVIDLTIASITFVYRGTNTLVRLMNKIKEKHARVEGSETADVNKLGELINTSYNNGFTKNKAMKAFAREAYITFQTMEQAEALWHTGSLSGFNRMLFRYTGCWCSCFESSRKIVNHRVRTSTSPFVITRAEAQPDDIIWENQGIGLWRRGFLVITSFLITAILVFICYMALYYIKTLESNVNIIERVSSTFGFVAGKNSATTFADSNLNSEAHVKSQWYSILMASIVQLFNMGSLMIASKLVTMSRPLTKTDLHSRISWRSSITMFVNSTIVVVLANFFTAGDDLKNLMYSPKGLAADLWMMLIFAVLDPFIAILDFQMITKFCSRRKLRQTPSRFTQHEANHALESPDFVISERIAKYFFCMMHFLFILAILPAASIVCAVYVIVFFWMDKFWLLRVCHLPARISMRLMLNFAHFFDLILVCYTVDYC